jgi:hypothetical protein
MGKATGYVCWITLAAQIVDFSTDERVRYV